MHIRDPIHGAIELTADERALVDSPQYQRLRNVKQLGFADLAFPGATHTRYAHGLGAMAMATKVFDALDRKSTRLNSSHGYISYAVFCLKKKKKEQSNRNNQIVVHSN